jgi:hypothetical protein
MLVKFKYFLFLQRLRLITWLISDDIKVISNITITSDIISYNKGINILHKTKIKQVSTRQSFVFSPNSTTTCS